VGFLKDVQSKTVKTADQEAEELLAFAREKLGDPSYEMKVWDEEYFAQLLGKEKYDIDPKEIEKYFEFENTMAGIWKIFEKNYHLRFEPIKLPTHHPDVRVFKVFDETQKRDLGLIYYDPFSRAEKGIGSWAMAIKDQHQKNGQDIRPHVFLATDITKSVNGKTFFDLENLLALPHEGGHGVHILLSQVGFQELAGMAVPDDFVETPSSLMEYFINDPSILKMIGRHAETGEVIPDRIIEMIQRARAFRAATYVERGDHGTRRALLDIALHREDISQIKTREDLIAFEDRYLGKPHGMGSIVRAPHSNTFSYIFYGGYEANFHSYLRSWQTSASGYLKFQKNGVLNPTLGRTLRTHTLSQGGVYQSLQSYEEDFLRDRVDPNAFLRLRGIPVGQ
jgi:peptidyl-dipeptidase Dcp